MIPNTGLFDKLLVPTIIILVGVAAFGLGRLSATDTSHPAPGEHQEGAATGTPKSTVY